jgi:membrane peptidoglycan carboxypeptidase
VVLAVLLTLLMLPVVVFAVLYATINVPLPNQIQATQVSVLTYSNGAELARIGAQNRTDVPLSRVPMLVQYAVLAAEDRNYWSEPGVSVRGIARALYNDARGRNVQGGSTITQQYVKNAYLTQERTLSRKTKEAIIAIKLNREFSKQQILEWYLNTIYYGRGAYGLESAAETYFHLPVQKLTVAQGAVLAASIRSPALYDPQEHPDSARARWQFVIDGMAKQGWITQGDAATLAYPKVQPRIASRLNQVSGPNAYAVEQVKDELANLGFDEALLNRKGLRVQTTIDQRAQAAAVTAVNQTFAGQPATLRQALVAVDPTSGAVRSYYGGASGTGFDYAQAWRPPGSSFKPYVLATALSQSLHADSKLNVYSTFDGTSPRTIQGQTVHNSENAQCPNCTLLEAMKRSINTVFYDLAVQVGPKNVAAMAQQMGVAATHNGKPTLQQNGTTAGGIGIGQYEVRPVDQAVGFSTLADGGVRRPAYFVQRVTDTAGHVLYQRPGTGQRVLDAAVANDVTYSMEPVAAFSRDALASGRPSAAKTGTQQFGKTNFNSDVWMVGFTPQISTAVWVGSDNPGPLKDANGNPLFGRGLPGLTWKTFMDTYLSGQPSTPLPATVEVKPAPPHTTPPPSTTPPPVTTPPPATTPVPTTPPPSTTPPRTPTPTPTPTRTAPTSTRPPPTTTAPAATGGGPRPPHRPPG